MSAQATREAHDCEGLPWPSAPLLELCDFHNGLWTGKKGPFETANVIRNTNFTADGRIDLADVAVLEVEARHLAKRRLQKSDIIIEKSGGGPKQPVGRVVLFDLEASDYSFSNFTSAIRVKKGVKLDPVFLHRVLYWWYVSGRTEPLQRRSTGIRNLDFNAYKELAVPLPPVEEQKRIVAILDQAFAALDRARTHAEANLVETEALFENVLFATFDALISSSEMKTLAAASDDFSRGKSRHRPRNDPALYGGDYPFIQTGDIRRSQGSVREHSQTYNDVGLAQSKLWPVGTVCITIAANIAETGVLEFDGCFPDSVIGMVPKPNESTPYYVEYMLRYFAKDLKLQGKGSAQDNINLATFENAQFPFPTFARQIAVVEKLDGLAAQVDSLRSNYSRTLDDIANLRQSLLQKAFSGQL